MHVPRSYFSRVCISYHINKRFFHTLQIKICFGNISVFRRGFPGGSVVENPPTNARVAGFDPWVQKIPWRKKWQPTSVFLFGKSSGQKSLVSYSPWGRRDSDMIEWLRMSSRGFLEQPLCVMG